MQSLSILLFYYLTNPKSARTCTIVVVLCLVWLILTDYKKNQIMQNVMHSGCNIQLEVSKDEVTVYVLWC